jgi:hypothetical protein
MSKPLPLPLSPLELPQKSFYTHFGRLHFIWKWEWERFNNEHFDNQEWEILEQWEVFACFQPKIFGWFGYEDTYYDGHTLQSVTFLGITIGKSYTYESQPNPRPFI